MIQLTFLNRSSDYFGKTCKAAEKDWFADSYWVPVVYQGRSLLIARWSLKEC